MTRPLTKTKPDGNLYERRPQIEQLIDVVIALDQAAVLRRLAIADRTHPDFIPSEVILHLIRTTRYDNRDDHFERLYRLLFARVQGSVMATVPDRRFANADEVRAEIIGRFAELIVSDRSQASAGLDYYEVSFDGALSSLKIDCLRKFGPTRLKSEPIGDVNTGEISSWVEDAAQNFLNQPEHALDNSAFRSSFLAAIDDLPDDERRVIGLMLNSSAADATAVAIALVLGCDERTVRNRRDRALKKLKKALEGKYES